MKVLKLFVITFVFTIPQMANADAHQCKTWDSLITHNEGSRMSKCMFNMCEKYMDIDDFHIPGRYLKDCLKFYHSTEPIPEKNQKIYEKLCSRFPDFNTIKRNTRNKRTPP